MTRGELTQMILSATLMVLRDPDLLREAGRVLAYLLAAALAARCGHLPMALPYFALAADKWATIVSMLAR